MMNDDSAGDDGEEMGAAKTLPNSVYTFCLLALWKD
jgi:hypothetical protein